MAYQPAEILEWLDSLTMNTIISLMAMCVHLTCIGRDMAAGTTLYVIDGCL